MIIIFYRGKGVPSLCLIIFIEVLQNGVITIDAECINLREIIVEVMDLFCVLADNKSYQFN